MAVKRKINGQWRDVSRQYVKVNGQWRAVKERYVKAGGVWRKSADFFAPQPYLLSPDNWNGTYSVGVMSDGRYGADISGGLGNMGQTVRIGLRITGIPQYAPVSYTLELSGSDLSNTVLYGMDEWGNTYDSFSTATSDHSVGWSSWPGTEMVIAFQPSGNHARTASFRISNIRINNVLQ